MGIPSARLKLHLGNEDPRGLSDFKFSDYDSLWPGRRRSLVSLRPQETLATLVDRCCAPPPPVDAAQQALMQSFPFR